MNGSYECGNNAGEPSHLGHINEDYRFDRLGVGHTTNGHPPKNCASFAAVLAGKDLCQGISL